MEPVENRLFDLMENFSFEALSEDDRLFVLLHMKEEDFRAQQKIFGAANQLDYPKAIPLPLALPSKKGAAVLMTPIPLYKSLIGAAAAALLFFFFWPKNTSSEKIVYLDKAAIIDTIYKVKVVYDTVFNTPKSTLIAANVKNPDTVFLNNTMGAETAEPRILNSLNTLPPVELTESKLKNKGRSLKEEGNTSLFPTIQPFGSL